MTVYCGLREDEGDDDDENVLDGDDVGAPWKGFANDENRKLVSLAVAVAKFGGVDTACINCAGSVAEADWEADTEGSCVIVGYCCGCITDCAACAKACANASTFSKRCSGSFCNAFITTCSIAGGKCGICSRKDGGGVIVCFIAISVYDP